MADSSVGERLVGIEERAKALQEGQLQLRDLIRTDTETREKMCADHWAITRRVEQTLAVHVATSEGERAGLSLGAKVLLLCCTLLSGCTGLAVVVDKLLK